MRKLLSGQSVKSKFVVTSVVVFSSAFGLLGVYNIVRSSALRNDAPATVATSTNAVEGEQTNAILPYTVTVHGNEWLTAESGVSYFSISVSVHNASDQVQQFSPLLQTYVVGPNGVRYDYTADQDVTPMGGPINPGESVSGALNFKLTHQDTKPTLYFASEPGATGTAISLK